MRTTKKTLKLPAGLEFKVEFIDEEGGKPEDSIHSVTMVGDKADAPWLGNVQWARKWILAHCDLPESEPSPKPRAKRRRDQAEPVPEEPEEL